jgi:DNA-directed RNA polymerase specialized sigma24 family protein
MFTVIWSGSLERQGLCPGLSSYMGSACTSQVQEGTLERGELGRQTKDYGSRIDPALKAAILKRLAEGWAPYQVAEITGAAYGTVKRVRNAQSR